jgi:D-glycero-D-manno-heptose 1,7-bisphosphate phosphatase
LLKAAEDMNINLSKSYVVGDKLTDVQLAHNVGASGIMVLTGHGRIELDKYPETARRPDYTCDDLYHAVKWIINSDAPRARNRAS